MKKICCLIVLVLMIASVAYIALMARFETPICIDLTDHVQLSIEDHTLILPWYLRIGILYDCKFTGSDMVGKNYTKFLFTLPEIFESTELICIVCWETNETIAFVGDTRGMFVIDEVFPSIQWK